MLALESETCAFSVALFWWYSVIQAWQAHPSEQHSLDWKHHLNCAQDAGVVPTKQGRWCTPVTTWCCSLKPLPGERVRLAKAQELLLHEEITLKLNNWILIIFHFKNFIFGIFFYKRIVSFPILCRCHYSQFIFQVFLNVSGSTVGWRYQFF